MRLTPRLAAVAALCVLASPALAQAPVALQNTNNLSDCAVVATCRLNIGAAASGPNGDITSLTGLTTPLPLSEGGLGSTTAAGDRAIIGAAASGANSDITSLTAVTSLTLQTLQVTASRLGPGGNLLESATAPVIASGFSTSPSITANGTESFSITVGTGGTAANGVLTMPAAANGWNCQFEDHTTHSALVASTKQTGGSKTTVTLANFTDVLALGAAWTAGDVIGAQCAAY